MDWLASFFKKHGRLTQFDSCWQTLSPYPGFTRSPKAYRQVSQRQGKEMRNLGRVILAAVAASLGPPNAAQRRRFAMALRCVRALVDFHLMAQYHSHTQETLEYLERYVADFHSTKEVFQEFRASKKTVQQTTQAIQQLRAQQHHATQASQATPNKRRRQAVQDREEASQLRD
ncbi:MAG: hypothetical protein M1823_007292, partial [Watsoniomyces obsoletus]